VTPLELLHIQAEGSLDKRGRIRSFDGVWILRTDDEQALLVGAGIPDELAAQLTAPSLEHCRRILERDGALPLRTGPSYLIEEVPFSSSARIHRSDEAMESLRDKNPGNWHPVEWHELLDGKLGPCTMAVEHDVVVSICHTPHAPTARAAEAGVWTHADHRGRGHGAAATAAWAELLRPSCRHLFYSTDADNQSSQRVADRLRMRPLGHVDKLGHTRAQRYHPLSVLSR
jgi:RimJ/RimL family protein N-acetyltransferase